MTLEELEKKYAELGKQIEQMKAEKEWPQNGSTYFYIDHYLTATDESWTGNPWDEDQKQSGNFFRTEEEAQAVADLIDPKRLAAEARVRKIIAEERGDWRPDWKDSEQAKHTLYYNCVLDWVTAAALDYFLRNEDEALYFPESAKEAILNRVDPEDVKLMLGVKTCEQ